MKLHSFIYDFIIFLLINCFFVIPPLFVTSFIPDEVFIWEFPVSQFLRFIIAILIYHFYIKRQSDEVTFSVNKNTVFYYVILPFPFFFGMLFCTSLIIKACTILVPILIDFLNGMEIKNFVVNSVHDSIQVPKTGLQFVYCMLNFLFAAYFEEVIYRIYLPEFWLKHIKNVKNQKLFNVLIEILVLLIFAFSHIYMGILSVINAGIAHVILRYCYKRTGNIYSGCIAHFTYNIASLYLL